MLGPFCSDQRVAAIVASQLGESPDITKERTDITNASLQVMSTSPVQKASHPRTGPIFTRLWGASKGEGVATSWASGLRNSVMLLQPCCEEAAPAVGPSWVVHQQEKIKENEEPWDQQPIIPRVWWLLHWFR